MAVFKCKMCGANLPVVEGMSVCQCEYCGTKQTLPTNYDERIVNLFNRANYLRANAEFDKAQEIYEEILNFDYRQAEAHWGVVLCKYGIEYVEDAYFGDRIPTCHRTQPQSVLADDDYQMAIRNAMPAAVPVYEAEARQINELQKKILTVVINEKPYDVFICYKERDENGNRTRDSVIGSEIYHQLKNSGFKVFFAAITLEDKLGVDYEPYIYAALTSAKVMVVLGTKPEYFSAIWVKNEWSRYLHLMKTDNTVTRTLIPCYKDMDAYDLPADFSHLQALNMGNIAFIVDLIRAIQKLLDYSSSSENNTKENSINEGNIKRALMYLGEGSNGAAIKLLDEVLDRDPENAKAHMARFLSHVQSEHPFKYPNLCNENELSNMNFATLNHKNLYYALRYADSEYKEKLVGLVGPILYERSIYFIKHRMYEDAMIVLSSIKSYRDSEELYKDAAYNFGVKLAEGGHYTRAITVLENVRGYKKSDILIERCNDRIKGIKR